MRGWLIAVALVLTLGSATGVRATPLYGGYNGMSTSWVEYKIGDVETSWTAASILFGADTNGRTWVRMRISLVPLLMRLEYTRDYLGIQSVAVNTLFPWPVQLGSELMKTPGELPPWWITVYLILGVGGFTSDGSNWSETGIPGVYGIGADSNANQWLWVKSGNFLQGYGEDFNPVVEPEDAARDSVMAQAGASMNALQSRFDASVAGALARRLQSAAFAHAAQACARSLQAGTASLAAGPACAQIADVLSGGGTEEGLALLVEEFAREVQPLLGTSLPAQ